MSLSWPAIDCSRSAMPTTCARLGRFMLTRYFSISSPSCFCAPAAAPPTWFITLENSGEDMVWLARELNPFSISPIMFCHIATGSLLLSAIAFPPNWAASSGLCPARLAVLVFCHTTPLRRAGQHGDWPLTVSQSLLRCGNPCHRIPTANSDIAIPSGNARRAVVRPSTAADRPRQRHRHLLRDLWRRQCRTHGADHGTWRPDDPLGR